MKFTIHTDTDGIPDFEVVVNKEHFEDYERIREAGVCNMYDFETIIDVTYSGLTKNIVTAIIQNYGKLKEEYKNGPL